jgi:hypothetical protein
VAQWERERQGDRETEHRLVCSNPGYSLNTVFCHTNGIFSFLYVAMFWMSIYLFRGLIRGVNYNDQASAADR